MLISGHIVVRKPEWNYDFVKREAPSEPWASVPPYCGIDRCAWLDFHDAEWENEFDDDMIDIYINMDMSFGAYFWFYGLPQKLSIAKKICDFCNKYAKRRYTDTVGDDDINEIVAVYSHYLHKHIELADWGTDVQYSFLGFDVIALHEWSLILYGEVFAPWMFHTTANRSVSCTGKWYSKLNKYGLFNTLKDAKNYTIDYEKDVQNEIVEQSGTGYDYPAIYALHQ